ncbi:hypothetical protein AVEN_97593-1 [Araneus ventricosus]|uniref:Uncharacterized protein n=1 Tax=Araneus ventricosus TaxID=182803 RepID=A0A4Y2F489_ARAVE|nr:hypothetical protein AVEN_97593-1 [Araneus ventricosus]
MESLCNHGRHDPIIGGPALRPLPYIPPSVGRHEGKKSKKEKKNNNNPNRHAKGVLLPSPGTTILMKCPFLSFSTPTTCPARKAISQACCVCVLVPWKRYCLLLSSCVVACI